MSHSLFWLSDDAQAVIAPHLPQNPLGARRLEDRRVISGIIHLLKSGCRWADVPAEDGPPTTVYNRWNRRGRRGIWTRILSALTEQNWVTETAMIDSSDTNLHRCAVGAVRGESKASGGRLAPRAGLEATPSGSLAVVAQPRSKRSWMSSGGRSASS